MGCGDAGNAEESAFSSVPREPGLRYRPRDGLRAERGCFVPGSSEERKGSYNQSQENGEEALWAPKVWRESAIQLG